MRLLHVTDTHLGVERWFRGAPPGWRRADDHLAALRAALGAVEREEVDLVVHSGDLFDRSRPPARAVAEAADLLADAARRVPVVLVPGNHDRRGLRHHFPDGIPGVEVVDAPTVVRRGGVRLGMVPYQREAPAWAAAARALHAEGVDLLVAHQAFHGSRVPGLTFRKGAQAETVGEGDLPPVAFVLSGHIHTRQAFALGGTTIVHPGSAERTSFVERDEPKGITRWEAGKTWRWWFEDLPTRPMRVVERAEEPVEAGTLVQLAGPAKTREGEDAVIRAGGWVAAWAWPTRQLALFVR